MSIIGNPIVVEGKQVAVYAIYRDISERKQAQDALQTEKAYLEQLIETAQEAIVMADCEGGVLRVNGEFCRMFGYSREEALGSLVDDLVAPLDRADEALGATKKAASKKTSRRRKAQAAE